MPIYKVTEVASGGGGGGCVGPLAMVGLVVFGLSALAESCGSSGGSVSQREERQQMLHRIADFFREATEQHLEERDG